MLRQDNCGLVLVDVQGKLARMVHGSEALIANLDKLIQGCRILSLPIIWLEQNPRGLGPTVPELSQRLTDLQPFEKHTFNGCQAEKVASAIAATGRQQWLVCGIEAHVCVYQTVAGLLARHYEVEVVADCVSSRTRKNSERALGKMQSMGAGLTGVEMCLYELVQDARREEFRDLLALIR